MPHLGWRRSSPRRRRTVPRRSRSPSLTLSIIFLRSSWQKAPASWTWRLDRPKFKGDMDLSLYVVTDRALSRQRSDTEVVRAALVGGATVIQLRDKLAGGRQLAETGRALLAMTRAAGALLIVNDRVDVAVAI